MPNKQLLRIDIKGLAEAQADEKSENFIVGSFFYYADADDVNANPEELKHLIYLMQNCYTAEQLKAKPPQLTVNAVFIENNTFNLLVENVAPNTLASKTTCQEIHPNLTVPSEYLLASAEAPGVTVCAQQKRLYQLDTDLIQLALRQKLITEKMAINIEFYSRAVEMDDDLFTPHKKAYDLYAKLELNKSRIESVKKSIAATHEILITSKTNNTTSEERLDQLQNRLLALANKADELSPKCEGDAKLVTSAKTSWQKAFEELFSNNELHKIRLQLIRTLQLTALEDFKFLHAEFCKADSTSKKLADLRTAVHNFNHEYKDIASIQLTQNNPFLYLDKSLTSKNFSLLQLIVNAMLKAFYDHSGLLWGQPKGKKLFLQRLEQQEGLFNTSSYDPKKLNFAWDWKKLQSKAAADFSQQEKDVEQIKTELDTHGQALDTLDQALEALRAESTQFKNATEKEMENLAKNHTTLRNTAARSSQQANAVHNEFLALPGQIKVLKQSLIDVLELAGKMEMPYDSLAELCNKTAVLTGKINEQHEATFNSTSLDMTTAAVGKVEGYQRELNVAVESFTQSTAPLKKLLQATADMQIKLQEQQRTISAKANAIIVTRKLVSILNDVKHFSNLTQWKSLGGGIKLTVSGITYKVPTSYLELFEAQKMLQEPLTYTGALAFLTKAKSIVDRAEARTGYRFFFLRVRSPELTALHNLIKGLNFTSTTFANNVDDQLDAIKPNWKMGYEDLKLPAQYNQFPEFKGELSNQRSSKPRRKLQHQASASSISSSLQPSISMQNLSTTRSVASASSSLFNHKTSHHQALGEIKEEKQQASSSRSSSSRTVRPVV